MYHALSFRPSILTEFSGCAAHRPLSRRVSLDPDVFNGKLDPERHAAFDTNGLQVRATPTTGATLDKRLASNSFPT
jgi:hypothetical protein